MGAKVDSSNEMDAEAKADEASAVRQLPRRRRRLVPLLLIAGGIVLLLWGWIGPILKEPVFVTGLPESLGTIDAKRRPVVSARIVNLGFRPISVVAPSLEGCTLPSNGVRVIEPFTWQEHKFPVRLPSTNPGRHLAQLAIGGTKNGVPFEFDASIPYQVK